MRVPSGGEADTSPRADAGAAACERIRRVQWFIYVTSVVAGAGGHAGDAVRIQLSPERRISAMGGLGKPPFSQVNVESPRWRDPIREHKNGGGQRAAPLSIRSAC